MNRTDAPKKQPVPFAINGPREDLLSTTPTGSNQASYDVGYPPITMLLKSAGGLPPKGQDMNQILFELSSIGRWFSAGALNTFDATFSTAINGYPKGAVLISDNGSKIFISTTDGNTNNPNSVTTGWMDLLSFLSAALASLASLNGSADTVPYFTGPNTYSLTPFTSTGRGLLSQTSVANALNYLQGAPINSPALTGTPTAPTAAAATNNTQIATTAFAQALITALIGGAPAGLNTLNKIAVAINNDPSFYTNIIGLLNQKAPLANPIFTGTVTAPVVNTGDFSSTGTANVATFNGQTVNSTVSATFAGSVLFSGQDYLNKNSVVYVSADNSNQTFGLRLTGSSGQRSDELFYEKIGTYAARRFVVISGGNTITYDMRQDGSLVCLNPVGNWQIYPDGNISGTRWGGYLSDYINNQISSQISDLNTSLRTWAASQFPSITYVNQTFMQDSRLGSPITINKTASTNVFTCSSGYTFASIDTGDVGTVTATARPIQKYINGNWITVSQL